MQGNLKPVLRDVFLIFLLTFLGGFVIGIVAVTTGAGLEQLMVAIAVCNFLFASVGFAIGGCLVEFNRFRHLVTVAVLVWIGSLVNVLFFGVPMAAWLMSSVFIVISMLAGGGISYLIVKPSALPRSSEPETPLTSANISQSERSGGSYLSVKEWCFSTMGSVVAGLITAGLTSTLA